MVDLNPHRPEAKAIAVQLGETVAVRFAVELPVPNGTSRTVDVNVYFPDETRALLETMSWTSSGCILDVVFAIGGAYAGSYVMTRCPNGLDEDACSQAGRVPMELNMPLGFLRAGLNCRESPKVGTKR